MLTVYSMLASVAISLIAALLIIPQVIHLAHRHKWYDDIDDRKIHTKDTPHIGGVGIFAAALISILLFYILNHFFFNLDLVPFVRLLPFIGVLAAIHITGIVDDFTNMRARYKFLLQLAGAAVLVFTGFTIKTVALPWSDTVIHLGPAAYIISILWIIGVSNAINFIDGMDGLSAGISLIAALTFGIVFSIIGSVTSAFLSFALFGALIGFLVFNWPPAKIFMGDNGAIFIGFALGALPFLEQSGDSTLLVVCVLVSVVLFPVFDTFTAIIRRVRRKIPIIVPDKKHTHHKLLDFGISEKKALIILYTLSAIPCISVVVWAATGNYYFFWLVAATWLVMLIFFIVLDVKYHGKENRMDSSAQTEPQP